jgi:hypothetical protein
MITSENTLSSIAKIITNMKIVKNIQHQSNLPEMAQFSNINVSQVMITPLSIPYGKKKSVIYAEILTILVLTRADSPFPKRINGKMKLNQPFFFL